ncbi:MAG: hypothetical protein WC484_08290, partial [Candidatus Omnitrophota bacterium]
AKALATAAKLDRRSATGVEILQKLLKEKTFYASTSRGFEPLPRFKSELFFQLWQKIDIITTQENKNIGERVKGNGISLRFTFPVPRSPRKRL